MGSASELHDSIWRCSFTYVSLLLAAAYFSVLTAVVHYSLKLMFDRRTYARKLFLFFVTLQCVGMVFDHDGGSVSIHL